MNKTNIVKLIFFFVVIALIALVGLFLTPYLTELNNLEDAERLLQSIRELGIFGIVVFSAIQMLQVVIFVIPGEIIEVLAGMLYGPIGGFVVCMAGIAVGTTIIFSIAKKLGFTSTQALFKNSDHKILRFLQKNNRVELLLFILYFFPGLPKDMFTYFVPFTNVSLKKFLIITLIARIPSVISSTYVGAALLEGDIFIAVIIYAVIGLLAVIAYVYQRVHKLG